jgi:hypothetical protein
MRLRNSFWAAIVQDISDTPAEVMERIRAAMLHAFHTHCHEGWGSLGVKIAAATDISELWYARPELAHAITQSRDENVAQDVLNRITMLFKEYPVSDAGTSGYAQL